MCWKAKPEVVLGNTRVYIRGGIYAYGVGLQTRPHVCICEEGVYAKLPVHVGGKGYRKKPIQLSGYRVCNNPLYIGGREGYTKVPCTYGGVDKEQCTLYIVHCTLYIVHCTLYIVHCTMYIVQCTLYITALHRTL